MAKLKRLWSLPRRNLHLVGKKMYIGTQREWEVFCFWFAKRKVALERSIA